MSTELEEELRRLDSERIAAERRVRQLQSRERAADGTRAHPREPDQGRFTAGRGKRPREDDNNFGNFKRGRGDGFRDNFRNNRPDFRPDFNNRRNGDFENRRRPIEEDQPAVSSSVVRVEKNEEKPVEKNEQVKSRNRKMFGFIVGTLQQFQKQESNKSDVDVKRAEIESKVTTIIEHQKTELVDQYNKTILEEKEKELEKANELRRQQEELEGKLLGEVWTKHRQELRANPNFRKTKAFPPIFFCANPEKPFAFPKSADEPEEDVAMTNADDVESNKTENAPDAAASSSPSEKSTKTRSKDKPDDASDSESESSDDEEKKDKAK